MLTPSSAAVFDACALQLRRGRFGGVSIPAHMMLQLLALLSGRGGSTTSATDDSTSDDTEETAESDF